MYLGIRPAGVALTTTQARLLDDEFFLADPLEHFTSRIHMLLNAETPTSRRDTHPEFFEALGLRGLDVLPTPGKQRRDVQRAVDAIMLRHQCAEALERFLYAVTAGQPAPGDAQCTWITIADSPTSIRSVAEATKKVFDEDQHVLFKLMFPAGTELTDDVAAARTTALAWINHATHLLLDDELPVNAAYNKLKHGLAVTTRDDVRVELITTAPDENDNVPLSAFQDGRSTPIFDRPLVTYLTRSYSKRSHPKRGLEAISLRIDVPTVLAETWMMATVYATLFHTAALQHFSDAPPPGLAARPPLVIGRTPDRVLKGKPLGYRTPVTLPADGTSLARAEGLALPGKFIAMTIDPDSKRQGRIVEN